MSKLEPSGPELGGLVHGSDALGHELAVVADVLVVRDGVEPLEVELVGQGLAAVGRVDGVGDLGLGQAPLLGQAPGLLQALAQQVAGYAVAPVARVDPDVEDLQGAGRVVHLEHVHARFDLFGANKLLKDQVFFISFFELISI